MTVNADPVAPQHAEAQGGMRGVLAIHDFRLLLLLQFLGGIRQPMQFFTQAWYVNTVAPEHLRVLLLGLLSTLQGLAYLAYILFGGALTDRLPRRTMLAVTHGAGFVALVGTGALLLLPDASVGSGPWLWVMMVVFTEFGLMVAQDVPARQALVAECVPAPLRSTAATVHWLAFSLAFSLAFIGAAPLVGRMIQHLGFAPMYFVASTAHLVSVAMLLRLRHRGDVADPGAAGESIIESIRVGVRYLGENAAMRWVILITWLALAAGIITTGVLVAAWVRDVLLLDAAGWGVMALFWGVGGVGAAVVLIALAGRIASGQLFIVAVTCLGAAVLGFSLSRSPVFAAALFFIAGLCFQAIITLGNTIAQDVVPNRLLGRVMGLLWMAQGLAQSSGVIMGALAQLIGLTVFYPILGGFILLVGLLAGMQRPLRTLR